MLLGAEEEKEDYRIEVVGEEVFPVFPLIQLRLFGTEVWLRTFIPDRMLRERISTDWPKQTETIQWFVGMVKQLIEADKVESMRDASLRGFHLSAKREIIRIGGAESSLLGEARE